MRLEERVDVAPGHQPGAAVDVRHLRRRPVGLGVDEPHPLGDRVRAGGRAAPVEHDAAGAERERRDAGPTQHPLRQPGGEPRRRRWLRRRRVRHARTLSAGRAPRSPGGNARPPAVVR
ncbi:hypothetical protein GCM10025868_24630 [Angustibacter aerolatus]|uniref:Uncharacterized protein n=1 Tax=Angustibacter aerolatus TaxID=1162965 RepID=A0ABQ6JIJ2_9ACTN|nr:hypothetical protein GCM10025868_24630 [Angustibacter aerolatus]